MKRTENIKYHKYEHLAEKLKQMHGAQVMIVPIVIIWDGLVAKMAIKDLERLGVSDHIFASMQSVVMRYTVATMFGGDHDEIICNLVTEMERESFGKLICINITTILNQ